MINNDKYEQVKNMTLEELVLCVMNKYNDRKEGIDEQVYSIDQVISKYSFFTRYSLNKAIMEEKLPYFKIGSKKYFKKEDIELWIKEQQK